MTTQERVARIQSEQADARAGIDPEWLETAGPRPTLPTARCRVCGEYGLNCFGPGGVYVDTGLCADCEEEVLALAVVVREAKGDTSRLAARAGEGE